MIRVNLLEEVTRRNTGAGLAASPLKHLNLKMLLVGIGVYYALDYGSEALWKWELEGYNTRIAALNKESDGLAQEVAKVEETKNLLTAYKEKLVDLQKRSLLVDQITSKKTNPQKLLESLAKNMPEDLWLTKLRIEDAAVSIEGMALVYKSIGDFMGRINATPYFAQSVSLADAQTVAAAEGGPQDARLERFSLRGSIQTFDPFGN